jgi:hypothetical protein
MKQKWCSRPERHLAAPMLSQNKSNEAGNLSGEEEEKKLTPWPHHFSMVH